MTDAADYAELLGVSEQRLLSLCVDVGSDLGQNRELDAFARHDLRDASAQLVGLIRSAAEPSPEATLRYQWAARFGGGCALLIGDGQGQALKLSTPIERPAPVLSNTEFPLQGESLPARCYQQRQALISTLEPRPLATVMDRQLLRFLGGEALVCVPIFDSGSVLAVVAAGISVAEPLPDQHRLQAMQQFVQQRYLTSGADAGVKPAADGSAPRRIREFVHEFSDPVTVMRNTLHMLSERVEDDPEAADSARIIDEELGRLSGLVDALSGRNDTDDGGECQLNEVIRDVAARQDSSAIADRDIRIRTWLDRQPIRVAAHRDTVAQILGNLIRNAAAVAGPSGCITLSSFRAAGPDRSVWAGLEVRDNGPGIDPELISSLFEPGVKGRQGGGSGLGLSIVRRLVDQARGQVRCMSSSAGTTFTVLLPLAAGSPLSLSEHQDRNE